LLDVVSAQFVFAFLIKNEAISPAFLAVKFSCLLGCLPDDSKALFIIQGHLGESEEFKCLSIVDFLGCFSLCAFCLNVESPSEFLQCLFVSLSMVEALSHVGKQVGVK
jgi:hypothetical protein